MTVEVHRKKKGDLLGFKILNSLLIAIGIGEILIHIAVDGELALLVLGIVCICLGFAGHVFCWLYNRMQRKDNITASHDTMDINMEYIGSSPYPLHPPPPYQPIAVHPSSEIQLSSSDQLSSTQCQLPSSECQLPSSEDQLPNIGACGSFPLPPAYGHTCVTCDAYIPASRMQQAPPPSYESSIQIQENSCHER